MAFINLGVFERYTSTTEIPGFHIALAKRADGQDLTILSKTVPDGMTWVLASGEDNRIWCATNDFTMLPMPVRAYVIGIDRVANVGDLVGQGINIETGALTPLPAPVPMAVTRGQARMALYNAGLLEQVEEAVAAADMPTKIWYSDAQTWLRQNPILTALGGQIGLTDDQIDDLFRAAAAIQ